MALVLRPLVPLMSDQAVNILSPAGRPGPEAGTVPTPCLWGGVQSLAFLFEGAVKGHSFPNSLPGEDRGAEKILQSGGPRESLQT